MKHIRSRWVAMTLTALAVAVAGCGASQEVMPQVDAAYKQTKDASTLGQLDVTLVQKATDRKLLATVSDVARYRITVTGASLAEPLVKDCPAPNGSSGKVSTRFLDLLPGEYTVTVEALGADGTVLGSGTQQATVVAGKCVFIDMHIKLDPTYVENSKGHLGVKITLEDGEVIEKPIEACQEFDGFTPLGDCPTPTPSPTASASQVSIFAVGGGLAIDGDAQGFAYVTGGTNVRKISPSGEVVQVYSVPGGAAYGIGVDKFGNIWTTNSAREVVSKIDGTTGEVSSFTLDRPGTMYGVDFDQDGNVYAVMYGPARLYKLAQDGSILANYQMPFGAWEVAVAPNGEVWVSAGSKVTRLSSTGEVIGNYTGVSNAVGICIDSIGNVWVANKDANYVTKFGPDGELLGQFDVGFPSWDIVVDRLDRVWVSSLGGPTVQLANDGQVLGRYQGIGTFLGNDGQGNIWGAANTTVGKITP